MRLDIDLTAWSHGQVTAKLWLVEELEKLFEGEKPRRVAFFGGWYGIGPFLMLSRDRMPIQSMRSFDIDMICEAVADKINTAWVIDDWKFKAVTEDVNTIDWLTKDWVPQIVVNTSTEHFEKDDWFENLHPSMVIAIQSNNQVHDQHVSPIQTLDALKERYPMSEIMYEGEKDYEYPDKSYSRFMVIGKK